MARKQIATALNSLRPRKVFQYSYSGKKNDIKFDNSCLKPVIKLPKWVQPGEHFSKDKLHYWDVRKGVNTFKSNPTSKSESTVRNLLLTYIKYDTSQETINKEIVTYPLLCHNGFFNDVVLKTKDEYEVIYYKGQYIIAGTNRRVGQDPLMSFIGLKFEKLVKGDLNGNYKDHYKALLSGKYGAWPFFSVVEVDGITSGYSDSQPMDEEVNHFVEMKLCFVRNEPTFDVVRSWNDNMTILRYLDSNVSGFKFKLAKFIQQCYFGRQDTIIIGLRNKDFKIVTAFEMPILDLINYSKRVYPDIYRQFQNSIFAIDQVLNKVDEFVLHNLSDNDKENVFLLRLAPFKIQKASKKHSVDLFNRAVIPEYIQFRNDKAHTSDEHNL